MFQYTSLPIHAVAGEVCKQLVAGNVVLQAEPGAGKSTGLPLNLLQAGFNGKILMLEPRRLAAQNVASRLASQLGEPLGKTIGLRMRGRTEVSADTILEVVTEGVLTRILQQDPLLDGVALVIFDEFHERSLHADLGLVLCLDVQNSVREDLRLLLMSATLDGEGLCKHLGLEAPVTCAVRQHPVEILWEASSRSTMPHAMSRLMSQAIVKAVADNPGDVLAFLPGVAEIAGTFRELQGRLPEQTEVHQLHGGASFKSQQAATAQNSVTADGSGHRRVILSTSIAETSITIEGVCVVVDSGVERRSRLDPATGIERLETVMANRASATQRAGRAGRTQAGVCYRLWSEESHGTRAASWQPEILRSDLTALLMELGKWGVSDIDSLPWIDKPPESAIKGAKARLTLLGMWTDNGISTYGRTVAELPVTPRLGHMLLWAKQHGAAKLACKLAAIVEDMPRVSGADISGVLARLTRVHERRAEQLYKQLKPGAQESTVIDPAVILLRAFIDRIAQKRRGNNADNNTRYLLSGGAGALLRDDDPLAQSDYLVVASLGGSDKQARVFAALSITEQHILDWCGDLLEEQNNIAWDDRKERVVAERQLRLGALVISSKPIHNIDKQMRAQALITAVRKKGLQCLEWSDAALELRARIDRMQTFDAGFPRVDDNSLIESLEDWLLPYVVDISSFKALKQLDMLPVIRALLNYQQQQLLDQWFPQTYKVPSGSEIRLRYTDDGNPVLAVKLQEMFGCLENPTVARGRVNLKVELLSPARRPVQVTEDLGNFWQNSYPSVKKDLAGRYPKHPWPDDPVNAEATAYTKARAAKGR